MIHLDLNNIDIMYQYIAFYKVKYDSLSSSVDFNFSIEELNSIYPELNTSKNSSCVKISLFDNSLLKDYYYIYILQESELDFTSKFYPFISNLIFT